MFSVGSFFSYVIFKFLFRNEIDVVPYLVFGRDAVNRKTRWAVFYRDSVPKRLYEQTLYSIPSDRRPHLHRGEGNSQWLSTRELCTTEWFVPPEQFSKSSERAIFNISYGIYLDTSWRGSSDTKNNTLRKVKLSTPCIQAGIVTHMRQNHLPPRSLYYLNYSHAHGKVKRDCRALLFA